MIRRAIAISCLTAACLPWFFSTTGSAQDGDSKLDKAEAKKAFDYLNAVRLDPASFSKEIEADLKDVAAKPALKWNAILAKVAEERALDMATREYFGHVNPDGFGVNVLLNKAGYKLPERVLKDKTANFFESISAGAASGKGAIRTLIQDKGVAGLGHRKHLLGTDEFNARHVDAGIGFARNPKSKYRVYVCVIAAHHP